MRCWLKGYHNIILGGNIKFFTKIHLEDLSVNIGWILESKILPSPMLLGNDPNCIGKPIGLDLDHRESFISIDEVSLILDPVLAVPVISLLGGNGLGPDPFAIILLILLLPHHLFRS